jgi:hypothetical protein
VLRSSRSGSPFSPSFCYSLLRVPSLLPLSPVLPPLSLLSLHPPLPPPSGGPHFRRGSAVALEERGAPKGEREKEEEKNHGGKAGRERERRGKSERERKEREGRRRKRRRKVCLKPTL